MSAVRIAATYAVAAAVYILLTDQLVSLATGSASEETWLQSAKGLLFVVITGLGLYAFLRKEFARREKLHATLTEKEARERAILDTAQEGIWSVDGQGVTCYVNEALANMLGYTREELIGTVGFDFLLEEDREYARETFFSGKMIAATEHVELRLRRKDESIMWALLSVSPRYDGDGRLVEVTGFLVDITQRKAHEEEMARSLKEKEVLIQEIHHRVKNNLQVISSFLNLQVHYLPEGQDPQHLRSSQNRVKSMALVHERLYQNAEDHEIEMSGYLADLVQAVRSSVDTSDGRIAVRIDCDTIRLDIARAVPVGLIVNELVSNSFEHGFRDGRRGTIHIRMKRRSDGWLTLEIGDDGNGVDELADVTGSNSLGLQIVRALADQLNGRLTWNVDHGVGAVIEIAPSPQSSS